MGDILVSSRSELGDLVEQVRNFRKIIPSWTGKDADMFKGIVRRLGEKLVV